MGCVHSTAHDANTGQSTLPSPSADGTVQPAAELPHDDALEPTAHDGVGQPDGPGAADSRGPQSTPTPTNAFDELRTNGGRDSTTGLNPFVSPPAFREPSGTAFDFNRTSDFLDLMPASVVLTNTPPSLSQPHVFGLPELTACNLAAHDSAESRRLRRSRKSGRPRVFGEPRCWAEVLSDWFEGVAVGPHHSDNH